MISYAQNFEDVILRRVFRDHKAGFYIDVGAMDPVLESVTKFFYDDGWSGINIEPNEWFYNKLTQERPRDINLNVAVGERDEYRKLHVFEQYGISTFADDYRDRFVEQGFGSEEKTVRITTLAKICAEHATQPIDFLKVDCEGWEKYALRGADWDRFRPTVLLVEATEPGTDISSWNEWEPFLLEDARYEFVYFDGLNRFYVAEEYSALRRHFQTPPNILEAFRPYIVIKAEQELAALKDENSALKGHLAVIETQAADFKEEVGRLTDALRSSSEAALHDRLWIGRLSQELAAARKQLRDELEKRGAQPLKL
jgi:FkbM family methyltransferase